jgi:precorrin-2/cobalt-factor-2 C20-methyltransferase
VAGDEAVTAGTLYGLGVGPGDVELLTLKAARLLSEVDVIAYPEANGEESLARRIVAPLITADVLELPFVVAMKRGADATSASYDDAADRIAAHLGAARDVAVLCEGDPFFYGSFINLHERLAQRFRAIAVPGVTSLTACAASLGRPLAAGRDILKVVPATIGEARLRCEIHGAEALAIIKVGSHFDRVRSVLAELHLLDRAAIIERSTLGDERVTALENAPPGPRPYFSTVLVYNGGRPWR